MAAGGIHEQPTIPVNYEAQKATKKELNSTKSINIPDIFITGIAAVGGWHIVRFLYEEAVKFLKELGQ